MIFEYCMLTRKLWSIACPRNNRYGLSRRSVDASNEHAARSQSFCFIDELSASSHHGVCSKGLRNRSCKGH